MFTESRKPKIKNLKPKTKHSHSLCIRIERYCIYFSWKCNFKYAKIFEKNSRCIELHFVKLNESD